MELKHERANLGKTTEQTWCRAASGPGSQTGGFKFLISSLSGCGQDTASASDSLGSSLSFLEKRMDKINRKQLLKRYQVMVDTEAFHDGFRHNRDKCAP